MAVIPGNPELPRPDGVISRLAGLSLGITQDARLARPDGVFSRLAGFPTWVFLTTPDSHYLSGRPRAPQVYP